MKILLEIEENKVAFVMELLKNFSFVKTTELNNNSNVLELTYEQRQAIDEGLTAVQEGRIQSDGDVLKETKQKFPNLFN
ncbi:MAG: hypothetical protein EBQ94_08135 [Flavobacteriales bacterium]|nr:hypothetical protein [Crocinitomicaceae bacterium]NBX80329.1 hypothetical protein [Flavobacteriales bacterium]NCA19540.1 hypothetical protein [Crocinitomicaceae bacterium]